MPAVPPRSQPLCVLFADVSGSTKLFETRGDVEARALIAGLLERLAEVCRRHDGRVVKTIGDEILCVFPRAGDGIDAAVAMQRGIANDASARRHHLAIRIGLHHGDCLVEADGDVFGDAVNTAARMAKLAGREQVVGTATSFAGWRGAPVRSLGHAQVAGKLAPIDVVDVVWQENPVAMTTVQSALGGEAASMPRDRLVLEYRGQALDLLPASPPLGLGRDVSNGLVVDAACVSRSHALVEFQRGHWILSDRSTNGSWLRIDGDEEQRLHREEARLRRSGVISLGRPTRDGGDDLVWFRCD